MNISTEPQPLCALQRVLKDADENVPRKIPASVLNELMGVDPAEYPEPIFRFKAPKNGARTFQPGKVRAVPSREIDGQIPVNIFHTYWFYLRRREMCLPESFCQKTRRGETIQYVFAGIEVCLLVENTRQWVYPCMLYHFPNMGRQKFGVWEFSHVNQDLIHADAVKLLVI